MTEAKSNPVVVITRSAKPQNDYQATPQVVAGADDRDAMHADLDAIVEAAKPASRMVLILFDDDTIARHWVRPAQEG